MASLWQATIGNVAAGSWFATLTSAGMGGAGLATVQIVTGSTAATLTAFGVAECKKVPCPKDSKGCSK
jgi:hypothetical protein